MKVVARYSFNGGEDAVNNKYSHLRDVVGAVAAVNANDHRTKSSKEKTMPRVESTKGQERAASGESTKGPERAMTTLSESEP